MVCFEIHVLLFQLKHAAVVDASLAIRQDVLSGKKDVKIFHSEGPKFLRVDLVEADEGFAQYANLTSTSAVDAAEAGDPGVVAITRVHTLSGIAATAAGPFDVRIILTEEPAAFMAANLNVNNGTASDPVALLPIAEADLSEMNFPLLRYIAKSPATAFGPPTATAVPPATTPFPNPTGRDNMYHVYSVTITPTAGHAGRADVMVNGFDDKVLPASDTNRYVGLTRAELLADTLTADAEAARDTRALNGREVLSVSVGAPALADIYKPATDHRGLNPRLTLLPEAAVIPAGGYLVLARGKTDSDPISGVVSVDPKIKEKKTAASLLYNVSYGFALSFPADDLSNFFRNGGTLQLLHADIAGNTAVATSGDDDTGYPGATTGAAVAGSVIISEIMWGLDAGEVESQYIELHNTTTADIGLDKQEWVIAVGAACLLSLHNHR